MFIPKAHRRAIYEYIFNEGVAVAKKDFNAKTHPNIEGVTNLEVVKALKSLASRELVKEQFAWRHYYWYLTDAGIDFLRKELDLPAEIVPATLKSKPREQRLPASERAPRHAAPGKEGDRDGYRNEKTTEAGPGASAVYRGGVGRGAPPPSQ